MLYNLYASLFGESDTVKQLGDGATFLYNSLNISDVIEMKLSQSIYGCVAIGGAVPPASPNDTILYNVDFSVIAGGSEVSSICTISNLR